MGGGGRAKQFRELSGTPIIIHTLRNFERCESIDETIVVASAEHLSETRSLTVRYGLRKVAGVVEGGASRMQSVQNGLRAVRVDASVVAVHDAVRPFVSPEEIDRVVGEAEKSGAAILAARAVDTLKEVEDGRVVSTPDRARLWHAQTPQCFRRELLVRAYERAASERIEATDDSALVEMLGASVAVIEGGPHNIKITTQRDLALAELLAKSLAVQD